jgi:hypothetical protein
VCVWHAACRESAVGVENHLTCMWRTAAMSKLTPIPEQMDAVHDWRSHASSLYPVHPLPNSGFLPKPASPFRLSKRHAQVLCATRVLARHRGPQQVRPMPGEGPHAAREDTLPHGSSSGKLSIHTGRCMQQQSPMPPHVPTKSPMHACMHACLNFCISRPCMWGVQSR